jgi:hypothetical protein
MNNLAYMGQDGQTVAPKVEELLRKELGAAGPIAFAVETEGSGGVSAGSVLKDVGTSLFGGKVAPLFTIHFEITQPRPIRLDVHMLRKGLGCIAGTLAYAAIVNKGIAGEVTFGDDAKFAGEAGAAGKLNGKKDVLKKCDAFAMKEGGLTGSEVKIQRTLRIVPEDGGAQLVAVTLPRSKSMGFSASLGSKEFLEIVALVESTL